MSEEENFEDAEKNSDGRTGGSGNREVHRVSVKVPPFWAEEPEVWFAQVENQFVLSGITSDSTKFYYVSGQLENEYARIVKDIIIKPPASGKYEKFKYELIKRISQSREKKTLQLLKHEELGDRKPSQFLRHLQSLAGPDLPQDFLRTIWSSRLPSHVQTIVASQTKADLEELAELADRVNDIVQTTPTVASTSANSGTSFANSGSSLELRVSELTRQVEALLKDKRQSRSRNRSKSRNRSNSHSKKRSFSRERPEGHPHCWYHFQFGAKAKQCKAPCNFNSGNSNSSR